MPWITNKNGQRTWVAESVKPTASNPVIKTVSSIANPKLAQTAITESARNGAFTIDKPKTEFGIGRAVTPITTDAYSNRPITPQDYDKLVANEQAKSDVILGRDPASLAAQEASRQYFSNLEKTGISQDELMKLTGATDVLRARDIMEGKTDLTPEQQLDLNVAYEDLKLQKARELKEKELMTEEERIKQDVRDMYAPQFSSAQKAGEQNRETALRVQGRAGMGSKSLVQQEELTENQRQVEASIAAEQRIQEQTLLAQARNAGDEEMSALGEALSSAKTKRQEYQEKVALNQAGLDEAAIKKSEFNTKMMLDALKEGFEYDPETESFTAQEGKTKIDQAVSKMLGYASDEFGNAVIGKNGQPLAIDKDNNVEWASYQDKYGNQVFYDKTNPSNVFKPGGTSVFQGTSGNYESSSTSDSSGVQILGQGNTYKRDDGSTGNLGENCVKFARENVPNLPYGLYNKQDKINAVNLASEQGFGGKGGNGAQIGDAILTGEGDVGHAAVIADIDEQGNFILAEANYKPGQVTAGRKIAPNDPKIYGYISSTGQPQMSSVVNDNAKNEGQNPAISTQVDIESGQEPTDISFSKQQKNEFDYFDKNFKLPLSIDNAQEEAEFMKNKPIYDKQQEGKYTSDDLKNVSELRKEVGGLQEVKDFKVSNAAINSIIKSADLNSGYGDIAMITSFMRLIDPSTGVKEGEFNNAEQAVSKLAQIYNMPTKWAKGTRLTAEGRQQLINAAKEQYESRKAVYNDSIKFYTDQAQTYGVKPTDIIGDIKEPDYYSNVRQKMKNPTPQQKIEIDNKKKQLLQGEKLVLREDDNGQLVFQAIMPNELLSTDIEL